MAAHADIILDQGTTFNTTLNLTDDNGQPIDLTGYNVLSQIRRWYTSSNSISFAATIPQPNNGIIQLSLDANATAGMYYGRYVYDVITLSSANVITRVVEGILTVTPEVTQLSGVTYPYAY
jgi:hypothetical protein